MPRKLKQPKEPKKQNGGPRPGAGMPKGYKTKKVAQREAIAEQLQASKEEARELVRSIITRHLEVLLSAQIANAQGIKYLVTRHKNSGKFIRVTEAMARAKEGTDEEIIEVWEKDPSVQAFTDLLNRAIDKPKEQEMDIRVTGDDANIDKLLAGRKRAADAREGA